MPRCRPHAVTGVSPLCAKLLRARAGACGARAWLFGADGAGEMELVLSVSVCCGHCDLRSCQQHILCVASTRPAAMSQAQPAAPAAQGQEAGPNVRLCLLEL